MGYALLKGTKIAYKSKSVLSGNCHMFYPLHLKTSHKLVLEELNIVKPEPW